MTEPLLRSRSLWILCPPIFLCCLDFGLTLYCQSPTYWSGNYAHANEMSPSFRYYLTIHPVMFVAMVIVWIALFSTMIAILPVTVSRAIAVTVVIGHMIGAGSWPPFRGSYQLGCSLILLTSFVIATFFTLGQADPGQPMINWHRTGFPDWTRWVLTGCLFSVAVWWFVVPH
jgi:hypothetical protein